MRRASVLYSLSIAEINPRMNNTKRLTTKHIHITRHAQFSWGRDKFMLFVILSFLLWLYITTTCERGGRQEPAQSYYGWIDKQKP